MTTLRSDPLLTIARLLVTFMIWVMGIAAAGCLAGAPFLLIFRSQIELAIQNELPGHPTAPVALAVAAMLVLLAVLLAAIVRFLLDLRRIMDTVGQGDPFAPVNADRLREMGWLAIGVQLVAVPLGALGVWVGQHADKADVDVNVDISVGGLFLALVLFILARVFRRGAEMRAELEGTV